MGKHRAKGFTIVELLIVIVVIAILAAIVIVAYNGIQERARNSTRINDINAAQRLVEAYNAQNGEYPKTTTNPKANWRAADVRTDDNCANGSSQPDWIPGVASLPQSNPTSGSGVDDITGCYLYVSNGQEYVISAWNMVNTPQTSTLYRRLGFREFQTAASTQFYTCNNNTVGGAAGGYNITQDYYKHSYTISNITDCNETPPAGA
jgi:prepilin-type N-terminal cleavage/methylation domain-containing protein